MKNLTLPTLNQLIMMFQAGSFEKLEPQLNLFLAAHPDELDAQNLLGLVEKAKGNFNKAHDILEDLLRKNPKNTTIMTNLGLVYNEQGNSTQAISILNRALALKPNNTLLEKIFRALGFAQKTLGLNVEALASFKKGFAIKGELKDEFQTQIAHLYRIDEQYHKAIAAFEKTDIRQSKTHQLDCIYRAKNLRLFEKKATTLLSKGESNPLLGALISHSNAATATTLINPFCCEPLDYIFKGKIPPKKLSDKLINTLVKYSQNPNGNFLHQELLIDGHQSSGNLLKSEQPFVPDLKKIIIACINHYRKKFEGKAEPFLKEWPKNFEVHAWLIKINPNGHLKSHIHKEGWLSGSIYLEIPKTSIATEGGISFSLHGADLPTFDSKFPETVTPVQKRDVVMFPSSLFHKTLLFGGNQNRISLAFDVVPVKP